MSPVEMRAHRAIVANPASKAIRSLLADAATVAAAMLIVVAAAETAVVGIEAAGKRASEEFQ